VPSHAVLQIGPIKINMNERTVKVFGREVGLTAKEYAVMELLASRNGMVVTREAFFAHLYGASDAPQKTKIIDVFVCKLRKKLTEAVAPAVIGTANRRGYLLRASEPEPAAPLAERATPIDPPNAIKTANVSHLSDLFQEAFLAITDHGSLIVPPSMMRIGHVEIGRESPIVCVDGKPVSLDREAYDVLRRLATELTMQHPKAPVNRGSPKAGRGAKTKPPAANASLR